MKQHASTARCNVLHCLFTFSITHSITHSITYSSTYNHPSLVRNIFETSSILKTEHRNETQLTPVGRTVVEYSLLVDLSLLVWWTGVGLTGTTLPPLFQLTLNILQEIVKA